MDTIPYLLQRTGGVGGTTPAATLGTAGATGDVGGTGTAAAVAAAALAGATCWNAQTACGRVVSGIAIPAAGSNI